MAGLDQVGISFGSLPLKILDGTRRGRGAAGNGQPEWLKRGREVGLEGHVRWSSCTIVRHSQDDPTEESCR